MSFVIKLQQNRSPANKVDKNILDIAVATGTLREETSIIDPVIVIQSDLAFEFEDNINYCYIEEFRRWYYITNIRSINTKLWEISCHVDVLYTYKTEIRAQTAIVARQEKRYNMLLDDGWFMAYQDPIIVKKLLSVSDPFEHQEFVLVVAGS